MRVTEIDGKEAEVNTIRSMTFWFGAIFFTGLLLVIVFARDWT